ncbi:hypothetical protein Tco_0449920 [Tanacetum coccineum]
MGTYKKDEADNNDEEEMANKKATNKKINAEFDPCDDPKFGKYYVENEHLFVLTQPRAEKKKDQTDDEQLESKKEKDQIGSSSQDTPVFGIDNSLQGSQPTSDLGGSPTKVVIIDNNKSDATYEGKYKDNFEFVRSMFGRHLLMYQNSNAEKILIVTKKATNLKMKWKTKEEKIDCGLYMIMHMELYEGSTAAQAV